MKDKESLLINDKIKKLEVDIILLSSEILFWQNTSTDNFLDTMKKSRDEESYEFITNYINFKNPELMIAKCNVEIELKKYQIKELKKVQKLVE